MILPGLPKSAAPELKVVAVGLFVLFLLGAALQVRRIHGSSRLQT